MKKIVILTTGQPSTNPRMLKDLDALYKAGYSVKVFYSFWNSWGTAADQQIIQKYPCDVFCLVGGSIVSNKSSYYLSRAIQKLLFQFDKIFFFLSDYIISRTAFLLARKAKNEKADLYIAHNLGALPAAVQAAKKWGAKCGFDAEDYHRGEYLKQDKSYNLARKVEEKYLPQCNYITAASPLIAAAYKKIALTNITVINNVFSKSYLQPFRSDDGRGLKLFWFSQTVGPDRGLEFVIKAINKLERFNISLHLMNIKVR